MTEPLHTTIGAKIAAVNRMTPSIRVVMETRASCAQSFDAIPVQFDREPRLRLGGQNNPRRRQCTNTLAEHTNAET